MWQILTVFFHVIFDLEKNRVFFSIRNIPCTSRAFFIIFVAEEKFVII